MCKGVAVPCAFILKVAFSQGSLISDTEWNIKNASNMQFEKKVVGNKCVIYGGQEDVSLFLHMYWTFSVVLLSCWNRTVGIWICLFHDVHFDAKCTLHWHAEIKFFSDDWRKCILRNFKLRQLIRKCWQCSALPGVLICCCPCKFLLSEQ